MKKFEKVTKEVRYTFNELEKYTEAAKKRLLIHLKDLPKKEMIDRINDLRLSDKNLNYLCFGIALEAEEYEICAAVQTVQRERALKNIMSALPVIESILESEKQVAVS